MSTCPFIEDYDCDGISECCEWTWDEETRNWFAEGAFHTGIVGRDEARLIDDFEKELVRRLKAMPYHEYLKTNHWQKKRKQALEIAKYKCQVCGVNQAILDVHHNTYVNRGGEKPEDLIVLCRDCHSLYHKQGKLPAEN